jgi:hypothetical protein
MVSFQEGSELLTELAGLPVDAKQVERTAEALGEEVAEEERRHSEPIDSLALPQTLYLGMDGTGIALRAEELTGRSGKQPDGSAKTGEVKLCTIWSVVAERLHSLPHSLDIGTSRERQKVGPAAAFFVSPLCFSEIQSIERVSGCAYTGIRSEALAASAQGVQATR